jgi:hypothetical protein
MLVPRSPEDFVPKQHPIRQTRLVGLAKNKLAGFMVGAAYDLVRLAKLLPLPEPA